MNYRERMKEYLKVPGEYSSQWGKWGMLNKEQKDLIKRLLSEMDGADEVIKHQYFEIERLNNIINELEKELFGMYVDIAEWNEDYAKKRIEKLKEGGDSENL